MILEDGTGTGRKAGIDINNQLHAFAISESNVEDAVRKGNAYNINTGWIDLTSSTASGVLYFKNNESPSNGESAISIDAIAIGLDDQGTTSGVSDIVILRNPTAGTIISNAVDVDSNVNRDFGSSNTLSSLAYKGVEGDTLTGGSSFDTFGQQPGTRAILDTNIILRKGSSIGITIDTQTSSGTTRAYVALILHRVDGSNNL